MTTFELLPCHKPSKKTKRNKDKTSKEDVRAAVKDRDGNWCLLNGKPGPGLHLHRVVYGGMGGGNGKYEEWNCVLLSTEMHQLVHSNKKRWMNRLLEYLEAKKAGDNTEALIIQRALIELAKQ